MLRVGAGGTRAGPRFPGLEAIAVPVGARRVRVAVAWVVQRSPLPVHTQRAG
jgi:hypothetical protein